jgi:hypothetical protein
MTGRAAGKTVAPRAAGKRTADRAPSTSIAQPVPVTPAVARAPSTTTAMASAIAADSAAATARGPAVAEMRSAPTSPGVRRGGPGPRADDDPLDDSVEPDGEAGAASGGDPADELLATRDIARLLRYGERIGGDKIDVRMLPLQFHARSGALAVCDPGRPETWHVLERPIGTGAFRVMLSIARPDDEAGAASGERLAAVVIHVGRPPIAKWTVAQLREETGEASPEALPRTRITGGWLALIDAGDGSPGVIALPPAVGILPVEVPLTDGRRALALPCGNGAFAAYWALDADDRPICVVVDFNAFTTKAWKARAAAQ